MRVAIAHETVYRYERPVDYSIQYLRLTPKPNARQRVLSWKLDLPTPVRPWVDAFGNEAHVLVVDRPHRQLCIRARGELELAEGDDVEEGEEAGPQERELYLRTTALTTAHEEIARFAEAFRGEIGRDTRTGLGVMMTAVREKIRYTPGATGAATTAAAAFSLGAGVCQDHTHVFLAAARYLGVPARYVSGYLVSERDQRMASHAWAELFLPGSGWLSFDVTNGLSPARRHVRVAVGLDYLDACPVRGFRRGGTDEEMEVNVRVGVPGRLQPATGARQEEANGWNPNRTPLAPGHQRAQEQQQQQQQQ